MFRDKRSGRIALVSHCVLNQNSRASGLAERSSIITEIVQFLVNNDIGAVQMPCPELAYAGTLRQPQTKEQYNNAMFRRHCRKIAKDIANQVREYQKCGIKLKFVIGVDGSPSCGVSKTSGILIEELRSALHDGGISAPFCGISYERLKDDIAELRRYVE
mgnify:CR=1 FL=1